MARTDAMEESRLEMARPRKVLSENGLGVDFVVDVVAIEASSCSCSCFSSLLISVSVSAPAPVNFLTPKTEREVEKRVKKNPSTITAATLSTSIEDPRD